MRRVRAFCLLALVLVALAAILTACDITSIVSSASVACRCTERRAVFMRDVMGYVVLDQCVGCPPTPKGGAPVAIPTKEVLER